MYYSLIAAIFLAVAHTLWTWFVFWLFNLLNIQSIVFFKRWFVVFALFLLKCALEFCLSSTRQVPIYLLVWFHAILTCCVEWFLKDLFNVHLKYLKKFKEDFYFFYLRVLLNLIIKFTECLYVKSRLLTFQSCQVTCPLSWNWIQ